MLGKVSNDSWLPMVVIALAQMLMSFNVSSIPVSMSGMVSSFNTPPTTVGTVIVMYPVCFWLDPRHPPSALPGEFKSSYEKSR
jgi:hypothetical protein